MTLGKYFSKFVLNLRKLLNGIGRASSLTQSQLEKQAIKNIKSQMLQKILKQKNCKRKLRKNNCVSANICQSFIKSCAKFYNE